MKIRGVYHGCFLWVLFILISCTQKVNQDPIVDAGVNQTVYKGDNVQLCGSAIDPEKEPLSYSWIQIDGNEVVLYGKDTIIPSFKAPTNIDILEFRFTASDGQQYASDIVTVLVSNKVPMVSAGSNQYVLSRQTVRLIGNVIDPDEDSFHVLWSQITGNTVSLSATNILDPTFTAPNSTVDLIFDLIVSDMDSVITDSVIISVFNPETKIIALDGSQSDYFGRDCVISGDGKTLAVIASGYLTNGAVYIYQWDGTNWGNENIITATPPALFADNLAISYDGDTFVIGDYYRDNFTGAAYLYKWNGSSWNDTILTASDGTNDDHYGASVAVSGDGLTLVVGSTHDDGNDTNSGSVYIYQWNGSDWDETKIHASDGVVNDAFGQSVAVSSNGQVILASASYVDTTQANSGAAYIYKWNGSAWNENKLIASDANEGDNFGYDVALSADGNSALISTWLKNSAVGGAYLYQWNGSIYNETIFSPPSSSTPYEYGRSVDISDDGDTFIVGASKKDSYTGAAYYYLWDGSEWDMTGFTASDGVTIDWYGFSSALSGDGEKVAVGAMYDDNGNGSSAGTVYIYQGF